MNVTYPIALPSDEDPVIRLRKDEVIISRITGKATIDISDAIEREFWKKSEEELIYLKNELAAERIIPKKIVLGMISSIDRVLKQRQFMMDNQQFRNALKP